MALTLGDNFSYQGAKPLDGRLKYDTLSTMKAVADATMYDGCMAYCVGTDKTYQWKSANTVDESTGKWREFSSGGGGGGASDLDDLGDVDISNPSNGQVLKYNSTSEKWENGTGGSGGASALNDLTDVTLTSPSSGQVLKYDGEKWINGTGGGGGGGGTSDYTDLENKPAINNITLSGNKTSASLGLASAPTVMTQTLAVGSTTVTFGNIPSSGNNLIDFFTSNGINYTSITVSGTTIVLTFPVQSVAVTVYCRIEGVS